MGIIWRDHKLGKDRLLEALESHKQHKNLKRFESEAERAILLLEVNREVLLKHLLQLLRARNHVRAKKLVKVIPPRAVRKWVYIAGLVLVAIIFILGSLRGVARI